MYIERTSFNEAYKAMLKVLFEVGHVSVNRKGDKLYELYDEGFTITSPRQCFASCRNTSLEYLKKEFEFYLSGSNLLSDAVKCSPFWKNCSDDGVTINSNYGRRIFHDKNEKGFTQFEHALNCLKNNPQSKKAVMVISSPDNGFLSNDNFCTMYLRARIDNQYRLHLTAYMRSNDVFFGTVYDVPFFVFVQMALIANLLKEYPNLKLGTYTHLANSLHMYERNRAELEKALNTHDVKYEHTVAFNRVYHELLNAGLEKVKNLVGRKYFMAKAWEASKQSTCLKKKVGCVLTEHKDGVERIIATGYGDMPDHMESCKTCARDDENNKFYECGCWSIHGEYRAIMPLLKQGFNNFKNCTMYVTHDSCDSCARVMDWVGIREVVYDKPYKIDHSHWPRIEFKHIDTV